VSSSYTEDHLVEQPAIQFIHNELGWKVVNCHSEWDSGKSDLGRDGKREMVLVSRLRPALQRLNPDLPVEAIEGAVEEMGILNDEFGILNGRGRQQKGPRRRRFSDFT
jgi:type I restriction enzyme R subunit